MIIYETSFLQLQNFKHVNLSLEQLQFLQAVFALLHLQVLISLARVISSDPDSFLYHSIPSLAPSSRIIHPQSVTGGQVT